jgi:alkylated DNA repair dioxygenase AlkB
MPEQLSMFNAQSTGPEGLRYLSEFITREVEEELIGRVRELPLQPFQFGQFEGKRRIASFGYQYDYSLKRLTPAEPIPSWLGNIIEAVESFGGPSTEISQVLCTEYGAGVGIGWHRDKAHFDRIFGLSLASSCKFRFRRTHGSSWQRFMLDAKPRSLYMMAGPARLDWEHSIPAVEETRYSITFRTMVDTITAQRPAAYV